MPKLILVKHSEPAVDLELPPSKWILSDRGKRLVGLLADYLAMRGIGALHSSDEIKTVQTAEIVGETIGLPVNAVHDLREHERHGTPIVDAEDWRSTVIESIRNQNEHIYGSEAVGTARIRFGAAVERLMETAGADQTVAVIAHGTVISTFAAELLDTDPVPIWESLGLPGLIEIEWPRPSKILTQLNFE
jgi:broad specificity phosphatase PhoE